MDYYVDTLPIAKVIYYDFVDMIFENKKKLLLLKTRKGNYHNQIIV